MHQSRSTFLPSHIKSLQSFHTSDSLQSFDRQLSTITSLLFVTHGPLILSLSSLRPIFTTLFEESHKSISINSRQELCDEFRPYHLLNLPHAGPSQAGQSIQPPEQLLLARSCLNRTHSSLLYKTATEISSFIPTLRLGHYPSQRHHSKHNNVGSSCR